MASSSSSPPDSTPRNPVTVPSPALVTTAPGRRRRRVVLPAVVAIVVAVLVVAALFLTGVLPGSHPGSSGSPGKALSYSAARSLADPVAARAAGGPWTLFTAGAYVDGATGSFGLAFLFPLESVGPLDVHYLSTERPGVPAFGGSVSSGLSPWWLFEYGNGTTTEPRNETIVLAVVVVNGTAIALATLSSALSLGVPPSIPGTGVVDSPAAVAAAIASNTSFVDAHPGLNASYGLFSSAQSATWYITFTTCAPFGQVYTTGSTEYNGTSYAVPINASSGAAGFPDGPTTEHCSSLG
jgi:hypothetical protein